MDSLKIGMQGQRHGSDLVEFEINPYRVAPPPEPISWAIILGTILVVGALYVVSRRIG